MILQAEHNLYHGFMHCRTISAVCNWPIVWLSVIIPHKRA